MTDSSNNPTATTKTPSYIAYHVRDSKSGKAFWTRIGSAWKHSDGKGFNIHINSVPISGFIGLRAISEKHE